MIETETDKKARVSRIERERERARALTKRNACAKEFPVECIPDKR